MASVNNYLKKLLFQYDCVVVPELGAFLTHYQPASFTETSGLFLPPRKRVAFNEALRLDDGILANYIMLHEPVTRDGAQRYISRFVGELRQQVTEAGRFEIDGIGTFTGNEEGKLQFDPSLRHNFFGEAYGMSAVAARSLMTQALEAVVVQPVSTAVGPVLVRDDETTLMPVPRSRPYWRVAAAVLLVGSLGLISYFSVIKPGQPLQGSIDPGTLFRRSATLPKQSAAVSSKTQPTATRRVEPTATLTPTTVTKSTPIPVEPVVAAPAPVAVRVPVAAPISKPGSIQKAPVAASRPVRTEPHFTVIAGSFASKRNALGLKRQLKRAGYSDAFVIMPGQRGQLYKVAALGSAVREEAIASVAEISALAGTEAWIYKN